MCGGFTGGRGGEHERRVAAVARGDTAQTSDDAGRVGAEHAAIDMALVDDHEAQRAPEDRPAFVSGQHRVVEQIRVGQDDAGVVADPASLVRGSVTVERRDARTRDGEGVEARALVGGERLRGREVERRGSADRSERADGRVAGAAREVGAVDGSRQHRHLVGERLARGGSGRDDDVAALEHSVECGSLMRPQMVDSLALERSSNRRRHRVGPLGERGLTGGARAHVGDTTGAGVTQRVEPLLGARTVSARDRRTHAHPPPWISPRRR